MNGLEKDIRDAEVRIFSGCLWKGFKLALVCAVIGYIAYSKMDCDKKENYVVSEVDY